MIDIDDNRYACSWIIDYAYPCTGNSTKYRYEDGKQLNQRYLVCILLEYVWLEIVSTASQILSFQLTKRRSYA